MSILSEADRLNREEKMRQQEETLREATFEEEMRNVLGDKSDFSEMSLTPFQRQLINEVVEAVPLHSWIDDSLTEVSFKYYDIYYSSNLGRGVTSHLCR